MNLIYHYIGVGIFWGILGSLVCILSIKIWNHLWNKHRWFRTTIDVIFWYIPAIRLLGCEDKKRAIVFLEHAAKRSAHLRNLLPLVLSLIRTTSKF